MGLDMYLYAEKYVSGYAHQGADRLHQYHAVLDAVGIDRDAVPEWSPHANVQVCVAYWRKANAIHGWFVNKVQGGVDECQTSYVTREQLQELLLTCVQALNEWDAGDRDSAVALLPPAEGFFFGGTELGDGDWFLNDLRETVAQVTKALALTGSNYYYRSSW